MGKFFNDRSARCTSCYSFLRFLSLARNDRHLYPIGQLYGCKCGASKVWTNSIRDEQALLDHYATGSRYFEGFCNDLFNGEGISISPWRSVNFPGEYRRAQVYGTHKGYDKFESGQGPDSTICVWSGEFSLEDEGEKDLVASYEPYVDQIKDLMVSDGAERENPARRVFMQDLADLPFGTLVVSDDGGTAWRKVENPIAPYSRKTFQRQKPSASSEDGWQSDGGSTVREFALLLRFMQREPRGAMWAVLP